MTPPSRPAGSADPDRTRQPLGGSLLTPAQAAHQLGTTTHELACLRHSRQGPAWIELTRHTIRYRPADLTAWRTSDAPPDATQRAVEDHDAPSRR